jgi:hypothetical protein
MKKTGGGGFPHPDRLGILDVSDVTIDKRNGRGCVGGVVPPTPPAPAGYTGLHRACSGLCLYETYKILPALPHLENDPIFVETVERCAHGGPGKAESADNI